LSGATRASARAIEASLRNYFDAVGEIIGLRPRNGASGGISEGAGTTARNRLCTVDSMMGIFGEPDIASSGLRNEKSSSSFHGWCAGLRSAESRASEGARSMRQFARG